jgi:hypothetical protein
LDDLLSSCIRHPFLEKDSIAIVNIGEVSADWKHVTHPVRGIVPEITRFSIPVNCRRLRRNACQRDCQHGSSDYSCSVFHLIAPVCFPSHSLSIQLRIPHRQNELAISYIDKERPLFSIGSS